jgi:hypothetical protein
MKKKHLLAEAERLIIWANSNIKGPSKLNDELEAWLNVYRVYHKEQR